MSPEHSKLASEPGHPASGPRRPSWPPAGLLLGLIGIVATLWLAATGQLGLYIHPRYFLFTTIAAGLALVATVAAHALLARNRTGRDHEPERPVRHWLRGSGSLLAGLALVVGLLVLPPATLSSSTVSQRELNSSLDEGAITLVGADPATFSLRDWAAMLADSATATGYAGQQASLTGFVTPSPDGDPDVFYLARFVVTCCTVDAQPVGVPVAAAGWVEDYPVDGWLEVTGTFVTTSNTTSTRAVVLKPTSLVPVEQPAQPYDF